ncbi:MAG: peptide chain release factor-like protein [Candidatus Hydrogenedentes bacterium]|nr:peptide chain release factor-like protein [Candidatus Hydrogenedentota bacterium]
MRMQGCELHESDLEEQFVRASGPGGQHVNRVSTCVELRHRPTGLLVKMQIARSQLLNRYYARRRMCELLEARQLSTHSPESLRQAKIRKQKKRRQRRRLSHKNCA